MDATYILPIRRDLADPPDRDDDLAAYLRMVSACMDVVVVDGSPPEIFQRHAEQWGTLVRHLPPDPSLRTPNGKVGGVLTGVRYARHERLVIADDDVRYDPAGLARVVELLSDAHVVRPQNYFEPLPWHARWDTARGLLNRMTGGDWPGTLAVRRSALAATGGYDGNVLFENLELVQTVRAAGGDEAVPLDLFVRRRPPTARHFWSQRVRQAYDEFARPVRLAIWLALLPGCVALALSGHRRLLIAAAGVSVALAEAGRRRGGGAAVFPATSSLLAPAWLAERAICIWLALAARLLVGGVRYRGGVIDRAATPMRILRRRHQAARELLAIPMPGVTTRPAGVPS